MHFIAGLLCVAIVVCSAHSQSLAASGAAASTTVDSETSQSTASGLGLQKAVQTHVVTVGKSLNQFSPDSLQAKVGDIVQFQFFPTNHSVVRAEYQQPCIPYEYTGNDKVGFFSGNVLIDKVLPNPPTWNLTINDTNPIFYYCTAPGSCINYGMVGVINPNSAVSLATQKQDATSSQYMLAPGQPFPSEEGGTPPGDINPSAMSTSSSATSSTLPSSSPSSSSTASSADHSDGGSKVSGGVIAGIVVAAVAGVLILAALFFLLGRQKGLLQFARGPNVRNQSYHQANQSTGGAGAPSNTYPQPTTGIQRGMSYQSQMSEVPSPGSHPYQNQYPFPGQSTSPSPPPPPPPSQPPYPSSEPNSTKYHDHTWKVPPYSERAVSPPHHPLSTSPVAELAGPGPVNASLNEMPTPNQSRRGVFGDRDKKDRGQIR